MTAGTGFTGATDGMQTVNFQCGNCDKLMAVSAEFLGKQVRCPHCQAVVVAPPADAPAPVPAASPQSNLPETLSFQPPQLAEQDDIFSPPEPTDDLFGRPDAPRVELPAEPATFPDPPRLDGNGGGPPAAAGPTLTWEAPHADGVTPAGGAALPSWMDAPAAAPPTAVLGAPAPEEHQEAIPHQVRRPRDGGGWFIGLVFIPLISYSLLATVAVVVLWYRLQQQPPPPPNPLENLPSFDPSDEQHSTHLPLNNKMQMSIPRNIDMKIATWPLPDNLLVRLGEGRKLRVGDLQIEPLRVDLEKVGVVVQGYKAQECEFPSLVLHLRLTNVSGDVTFQPMDRYFDRRWKGKGETPPLTVLELISPAHTTRLFGGPAVFHFPLLSPNGGGDPPQWVQGADSDRVLRPGEAMETFVCTDGDDKAAVEAVDGHRGKLLWRVHLRRGVVKMDPHRYVPVSSVVGVEFTDDDYRKSS